MRTFLFAVVFFAVIGAQSAYAEEAGTVLAPPSCIKATFKGNATTYNPYKSGWKTGGGTLATGGKYDANSFDAALQLGLAKKYGCGFGSKKVCHAVVQAPNGKSMIVRINDNGPMCADPETARRAKDCTSPTARVIDLNEKSMRYMSSGASGSNSGLIKNVTVTLLCAASGTHLGPLDPKERDEWAKKIVSNSPGGIFDAAGQLAGLPAGNPVGGSLGQTIFGGQGFGGGMPSGGGSVGGSSGGGSGGGSSGGGGGSQSQKPQGSFVPTQQYPQYQPQNPYQNPYQHGNKQQTGKNADVEYGDEGEDGSASEETASISCVSSDGVAKVRWSCTAGSSVSRGLAVPTDSAFTTRGTLAGVATVYPQTLTTYTVQCIKNQQIIGTQSCKLKPAVAKGVARSKEALLSISAEPSTVRRGKRATVTWSTLHAGACTVVGEGLAAEGDDGEEETGPLKTRGSYVYTLECEDAAGEAVQARARVEVQ